MKSHQPYPDIYQLRIVLRDISPLIWRRLLVRSDTTLAQHTVRYTATNPARFERLWR